MGCTDSKADDTSKNTPLMDAASFDLEQGYQVLDCSVGEGAKAAYLDKHIAGAKYLSLPLFRNTESPYPMMLPTKD